MSADGTDQQGLTTGAKDSVPRGRRTGRRSRSSRVAAGTGVDLCDEHGRERAAAGDSGSERLDRRPLLVAGRSADRLRERPRPGSRRDVPRERERQRPRAADEEQVRRQRSGLVEIGASDESLRPRVAVLGLLCVAAAASATPPGRNGKLAFRRWFNAQHTWGAVFTANRTARRSTRSPIRGGPSPTSSRTGRQTARGSCSSGST